jgi:DNA-binding MarR family transcriptional regulator
MSDPIQADLFLPRARRADSDGSHMAADALERSGRAARQLAETLEAVRRYPRRTSRELADLAGLDRHAVGRRLPELETIGRVRRIAEPGMQLRWVIAAEGDR